MQSSSTSTMKSRNAKGTPINLRTLERILDRTDGMIGTDGTNGTNEKYSQLHTNAFLTTTTTTTNTTITLQHDSNQHERVGALQSHHPGCDYTPVGPGNDTDGARPPRRKAVWPDKPLHVRHDFRRQHNKNRPCVDCRCEKNSSHCHLEIIRGGGAGSSKNADSRRRHGILADVRQ